jgi:hypothetical protein
LLFSGDSYSPTIYGDGRFVAFVSNAIIVATLPMGIALNRVFRPMESG